MVNLNNLFNIIELRGLTASKVSADTGISTGNISDWKKGRSLPTAIKLDVLADYFNCSVDYLIGRTNNPNMNATYKNIQSGNIVNGSIENIGSNTNITLSNGVQSNKEDTELLELIKKLPLKKRIDFISMLYNELGEE